MHNSYYFMILFSYQLNFFVKVLKEKSSNVDSFDFWKN